MKRSVSRRSAISLVQLEDRSVPATFIPTTFQDLDPTGFDPTTGKLPTGETTLRSAILAANSTAGPDTVITPAGTYTLTITGTGNANEIGIDGDLDVLDDLTLELDGAIIDGSKINDRVLDIPNSGVNVTINGGTITGGRLISNDQDSEGGGIRSFGSLTLNSVIVTGNQAIGQDGGAGVSAFSARGGGIASFGPLMVNGGEISNNSATGGQSLPPATSDGGSGIGGGISHTSDGDLSLIAVRITGNSVFGGTTAGSGGEGGSGFGLGGGVFVNTDDTSASVSINASRIDNNFAQGGAGVFGASGGDAAGGGIHITSDFVSVFNTTIDANSIQGGSGTEDPNSQFSGGFGGFATGGGAVFDLDLFSFTFQNNTVSGNSATGGEGISTNTNAFGGDAFGGGIYFESFGGLTSGIFVGNVTITDNEAVGGAGQKAGNGEGGGLYQIYFGFDNPVVQSTIIAGNRADIEPDVSNLQTEGSSGFSSAGFNLIGSHSGNSGFIDGVNNDQVGSITTPIDPLLTPLGFFGGDDLALVHALNIGSLARDSGIDGMLSTDQRGAGFDRIIGSAADVGAFEVQIPFVVTQSITETVIAGQPFTITGFVSDPRFQPTGTVEFFINGSSVGFSGLDASGNATIQATVPSPGPFTVDIIYSGDAAYLSAASQTANFDAISGTSTTVSVVPNPSIVTQDIGLFATVTPDFSGPTPTGTVQFEVDGSPFGSPVAVDPSGNASINLPGGLAVGPHTVIARYSGDSALGASDSLSVPFTVNPAPSTASVTVMPDPSLVTNPIVFSAAVSGSISITPTGAVQFQVDGSPFGAPVSLDSAGNASITAPAGFAVGAHTVIANYLGDVNFTGSNSPSVPFTVNPSTTTTILAVAPNPVFATDPIFVSATVTGQIASDPTGTVTFSIDGLPVGTSALTGGVASLTLPAGLQIGDGSFDVVATFNGDTNFLGSSSPATVLSVIPVPTSTILTASPNPATQGSAVTLTANVAFNLPPPPPLTAGVDPAILDGSVNFFNGTTLLGTAPIVNGAASFITAALSVGTNNLSAVFVPATPDLSPSTGQLNLVVNALPPSTVREIFAVSSGFGLTTTVIVYDPDGNEITRFLPYGPDYMCGAVVATGDVTGDGVEDIIVAPSISGGPHVKVFDGNTFTQVAEFFAYDPSFRGGVNLAAGDLDGDGIAEIVTGAGPGGGPQVNIYSLSSAGAQLVNTFFAYDPGLRSGVTVAVASGLLATGPGFTAGPHVKVFSGIDANLVSSFFAFDPNSRSGVNVALSFDGNQLVLTAGTEAGRQPLVNTFDALTGQLLDSQMIFEPGYLGGVTVTNVATPQREVRTVFGTGLGGGPRVRIFGPGNTVIADFFAFGEDFRGGVFVG